MSEVLFSQMLVAALQWEVVVFSEPARFSYISDRGHDALVEVAWRRDAFQGGDENSSLSRCGRDFPTLLPGHCRWAGKDWSLPLGLAPCEENFVMMKPDCFPTIVGSIATFQISAYS